MKYVWAFTWAFLAGCVLTNFYQEWVSYQPEQNSVQLNIPNKD